MTAPLTRRQLGGTLAAAAAAAVPGAASPEEPRDPLLAPKPPAPRGLGTEAALRFEALLCEFPETRVAAKRAEIGRQIATNLIRGRQLAAADLSPFDGPGPLWAAFRVGDEENES